MTNKILKHISQENQNKMIDVFKNHTNLKLNNTLINNTHNMILYFKNIN